MLPLAPLALAALLQASWKPAPCPIPTPFSKDVSPQRVHPEHPRPQLERDAWRSLNGLWEYAIVARPNPKDSAGRPGAPPEKWDGSILVPFPVESSLSGVGRRVEASSELWYRTRFEAPADWTGRRLFVRFEAVDYEATVWLNGKRLGSHRGGYDPFSFDATEALREGTQELLVRVLDATEEDQPRGKQVRKPEGIWYTPATGIWQTVWIEAVPAGGIDGIRIVPDLDRKSLRLSVAAIGGPGAPRVEAVATLDGKEVGRAAGAPGEELLLSVSEARPWTPEAPTLYGLTLRLARGGAPVDEARSYFALRKIEVAKDAAGVPRILLNGIPRFQVGTLDQGFWPDGIYTPPTDEAMRFDLETLKRLGFDMTRKHVKVECDRWYYHCDRLGLLVWQDMPSANNATPEGRAQFERELLAMIAKLENHPSVVMWVVFNEGWGQHDTARLTELVKRRDPTRLVCNASGWTDEKVGDVIDLHAYPGPAAPAREDRRAAVLGEFGGLGLAVEGHTWVKEHWGYQAMADARALARRYERLLVKAWELRATAGLCAAVYTQTTDVETECNGLLTYDRAVLKVDAEIARAANRGEAKARAYRALVGDARGAPAAWRFTTEAPAPGWEREGFDDAAWREGKGGFGAPETPGAVVGTEWRTPEIWLRRAVELPAELPKEILLSIHHDEDAEVYFNGVLAAKLGGFTTEYEEAEIAPAARAALRPGRNLLAVRCRQTNGGQYIDVGLLGN